MKTTLLFLLLLATAAFGQVDRVTFNTQTNALINPSAANLKTANSIQSSHASLSAITGNTGTLSLSGVTLTLPVATSFGGDRALLGTAGAGDVTLTFPSSANKLIVPKLSVSSAFTLPVLATDAVGLSLMSTHASAATLPLMQLQTQNAGFTGNFARFLNSAGTVQFSVGHGGALNWAGTATGNGSAITALNAANLATGTVPSARLGGGTANTTTFLRGDQNWSQIDLATNVTGVLAPEKGGTGFDTLDGARFAFAGGYETEFTAATEVDLTAANTIPIRVIGNTSIESFGTGLATPKIIRFTGSPILVHGPNLQIPGGQNLQIKPGDMVHANMRGSSVWQIFKYQSAASLVDQNWASVTQNDDVNMEIMGLALNPNGSSNLQNSGDTNLQNIGTDDAKGGLRVIGFSHEKTIIGTPEAGANIYLPGGASSLTVNPGDKMVVLSGGPNSANWSVVGGTYKMPLSWVQGTLGVANGGTGLTALGSPGQTLRVNGGGTALEFGSSFVAVKHRTVAEVTVANTAAETNIFNWTVPANTIGTTGALKVRLVGSYLNNTGGNRTFTISTKFGATTVHSDGTTNIPASSIRRRVIYEFTVQNTAVASQKVDGWISYSTTTSAATGTGALSSPSSQFIVSGTSAEDTTANKSVVVSITHSAANSTQEFKLDSAEVTHIP